MADVQPNNMYSFSSQPHVAVHKTRSKKFFSLIESDEEPRYANLMFDRRIVRGNTYAMASESRSDQDLVEIQRKAEMRRHAIERKRVKEQLRPRSPVPVEGRQHQDVQTHLYLEEITDREEEREVNTQTDAFLDRPPTPLFIPAKIGADVATQINEGDLFDFDTEVVHILGLLVGKTIEQSCLEVIEEEELEGLKAQQQAFEELREVEMHEQQRLAEKDRRIRTEKQNKRQQMITATILEQETISKMLAKSFSRSYLSDLVPNVYQNLEEHGYFYDPVERDIEDSFLPSLIEATLGELCNITEIRVLLDRVLRDVGFFSLEIIRIGGNAFGN
ncbi:Radial spoke head protein 3 [Cichlidogyrus casuarinus]|uniref:Radial spoke head protein 3 n=1 Tax=Cichlidogyrus casuarinus TaxID=1844966 RepID=A0ABD2QHM0_9PLAT